MGVEVFKGKSRLLGVIAQIDDHGKFGAGFLGFPVDGLKSVPDLIGIFAVKVGALIADLVFYPGFFEGLQRLVDDSVGISHF